MKRQAMALAQKGNKTDAGLANRRSFGDVLSERPHDASAAGRKPALISLDGRFHRPLSRLACLALIEKWAPPVALPAPQIREVS